MNLLDIARLRNRRTGRVSSYDVHGRNADAWVIPAGKLRVLADIRGPGIVTHLWMTQSAHYRDCLLRITWDNAKSPSVLVPLGDFFGMGHERVSSYQSLLFSASTNVPGFDYGCALNCYVPMPFHKRALIELVNESGEDHRQYFYVDYETCDASDLAGLGQFHAEFRRTNPFGGWGPEITVNAPEADAVNAERLAWDNNYVILETCGRGHYLGCNLSVTNFQGSWWGEGDDMIWVDGYKWPPDLHGTGSEDYLNQAWGMQPNAFLRHGSSIFEGHTVPEGAPLWGGAGGHQTSYVHHLENPVRFKREIKVTIEHGHANHLANEMSSVAYWYADKPTRVVTPPPAAQRKAVRKVDGKWNDEPTARCPGKPVRQTPEMEQLKAKWQRENKIHITGRLSPRHSPFVPRWNCSRLLPAQDLRRLRTLRMPVKPNWSPISADLDAFIDRHLVNVRKRFDGKDGLVFLTNKFRVARKGTWTIHVGHDGGAVLFVNRKRVAMNPTRINPAPHTRTSATITLGRGVHEFAIAFDTDAGEGWGFYFSFELPAATQSRAAKAEFPELVELQ